MILCQTHAEEPFMSLGSLLTSMGVKNVMLSPMGPACIV